MSKSRMSRSAKNSTLSETAGTRKDRGTRPAPARSGFAGNEEDLDLDVSVKHSSAIRASATNPKQKKKSTQISVTLINPATKIQAKKRTFNQSAAESTNEGGSPANRTLAKSASTKKVPIMGAQDLAFSDSRRQPPNSKRLRQQNLLDNLSPTKPRDKMMRGDLEPHVALATARAGKIREDPTIGNTTGALPEQESYKSSLINQIKALDLAEKELLETRGEEIQELEDFAKDHGYLEDNWIKAMEDMTAASVDLREILECRHHVMKEVIHNVVAYAELSNYAVSSDLPRARSCS
jgi:hypothetical protein